MHAREHRGQPFVGHALFAHEAVVAVFREILADAEGGLVDPAEVAVAREEGEREQRAGVELARLDALRLREEALSGAVRARAARVERREAPFGEEEGLAGAVVRLSVEVGRRHAVGTGVVDDAFVQIGPRVVVEGYDVAVLAGNLHHDGMDAVRAAREAAAEDHVVRVGLADGGGHGGEVFLGDEAEEGELLRRGGGGHQRPGVGAPQTPVFGEEGEERLLGGVGVGLADDEVPEAGELVA